MHRTFVVLVMSAWAAAPAQTQGVGAEKAIHAIVAEQAAAWDAGDAAGYARHVLADVSFTNVFGMVMYGAHDR